MLLFGLGYILFDLGYFFVNYTEISEKKNIMFVELRNIPHPEGTQEKSINQLSKTSHSFISAEYQYTANVKMISEVRKYYKQKIPELGWIEKFPKSWDYNTSDDLFYEKNGYRLHLYPGNEAFSWEFLIKYRFRGYDKEDW